MNAILRNYFKMAIERNQKMDGDFQQMRFDSARNETKVKMRLQLRFSTIRFGYRWYIFSNFQIHHIENK